MGKRRSRPKFGERGSKKFVGETPDPDCREYYNDEVDDFHEERDKIPLARLSAAEQRRKKLADIAGDEEVLGVRSDSDSSSDDDDKGSDEHSEESQVGDSDIEGQDEEQYLPSADAWGKRKQAFYDTDYVGDDRTGFVSSDEEAAQLEEEAAVSMQKRLRKQMTAEDFQLDEIEPTTSGVVDAEQDETLSIENDQDLSSLNLKQKTQLLKKQSPELTELIKEHEEKSEILDSLGKFLAKLKKFEQLIHPNLQVVQLQYEAYAKAECGLTTKGAKMAANHPVIGRILKWKRVIDSVDVQLESLRPQLEFLREKLDAGEDLEQFLPPLPSPEEQQIKRKEERKRKREEVDDVLEAEEAEEDDGKRAIDYQMAKNKGLIAKRKKEQRNPRVKHRRKFKKAVIRRASQVPNVRREMEKYGGESRGIKIGVVKSTKLS